MAGWTFGNDPEIKKIHDMIWSDAHIGMQYTSPQSDFKFDNEELIKIVDHFKKYFDVNDMGEVTRKEVEPDFIEEKEFTI